MEEGLHEEAARHWKSYILLAADDAREGAGAITTNDGHLEVPALILDFQFGYSSAGLPFVIFNHVALAVPPLEGEDDSE